MSDEELAWYHECIGKVPFTTTRTDEEIRHRLDHFSWGGHGLHLALTYDGSWRASFEVKQRLIAAASARAINIADACGQTALHHVFMIRGRDPHIGENVAALLERKADVMARDKRGRTPLDVALDQGTTYCCAEFSDWCLDLDQLMIALTGREGSVTHTHAHTQSARLTVCVYWWSTEQIFMVNSKDSLPCRKPLGRWMKKPSCAEKKWNEFNEARRRLEQKGR